MLKSLNRDDTQVIPFIVTNDWEISNTENEDLIIMENSGSDGLPVGMEYLEFELNTSIIISDCDIALEQQTNDLATFRMGLNLPGIFYPNLQPQNSDGTYESVIYSQIATTFYNNYRDPSKIWGLENIDFELSQTKRFIADEFKLFDIPPIVFGEKILPNSVILYDDTTDNNYIITDDGNCNLFAGPNIFSSQQELGEYVNQFITGSLDYCDYYDTISPPNQPVMTLQYSICNPPSITVSWDVNTWPVINYVVEKSTDGINFSELYSGNSYYYIDTSVSYEQTYWYMVYAENILGTSSLSPSASVYTTPIVWNTDPDTWTNTNCGPNYWIFEGGS